MDYNFKIDMWKEPQLAKCYSATICSWIKYQEYFNDMKKKCVSN